MEILEHKYALLYNFYQSLANGDFLRSPIRYDKYEKSHEKNLKHKVFRI